ncbi:MAG: helix-turn-helix domain-containing protein [Gemmatimonadota bacterium]
MYRFDLPFPTMSLVLPPYDALTSISELTTCADRGIAVVWSAIDAALQRAEYDWLAARPARVSLIIVLPPAAAIDAALPLLREANALHPRGVLPNSGATSLETIRLLLGSAPRDIPGVVVNHLTREGILRDQQIRGLIRKMFDMATTIPSITKLARKFYTSRRTLGRTFEAEGLPVPSHWLQFARLMYVSALIQEKQQVPIFKAARQVGYPDGFTMSNQMKRLIGCRPSEVRENLGLAWIIEEWIRCEVAAGRMNWPRRAARSDNVAAWLEQCPLSGKRPA